MHPPFTFIFFGSSGSGKGTQAKLLIKYLEEKYSSDKVLYIETGQGLRDLVESQDNYTAKLTAQVIDEGGFLEEFLPIWTWTNTLIKNFTGEEHLVLDGLARRVHEAPILNSAMEFYQREQPIVISLKVSREWATKRLMERGRQDDTERQIAHRLDLYEQSVVPAMHYFRHNDRYRFIEVNGEQDKELVHQEIVGKVFDDQA